MRGIGGYCGTPDAVQGCLGTAPVKACAGGDGLALTLQRLHQLTEDLFGAQHRCKPEDAVSGQPARPQPQRR